MVTRWRQRDALQRDPSRLERWLCVNLMKLNKAKHKVLHLVQGNHKEKHRLGREVTESSPEKDLGVAVDEKLLHAEVLKSPFFQNFFFLHHYDRTTSFVKWAVSKHPVITNCLS